MPTLRVMCGGHVVDVMADPRVSAAEVATACAALPRWGHEVERAWRMKVGLAVRIDAVEAVTGQGDADA